ncbi:MAG: hypothetical protein LBB23_03755 [Rickettsiales bacterium]|jgi:hypothetical protein|nr:hypothetical protein [Rickettsiales bacterium]
MKSINIMFLTLLGSCTFFNMARAGHCLEEFKGEIVANYENAECDVDEVKTLLKIKVDGCPDLTQELSGQDGETKPGDELVCFRDNSITWAQVASGIGGGKCLPSKVPTNLTNCQQNIVEYIQDLEPTKGLSLATLGLGYATYLDDCKDELNNGIASKFIKDNGYDKCFAKKQDREFTNNDLNMAVAINLGPLQDRSYLALCKIETSTLTDEQRKWLSRTSTTLDLIGAATFFLGGWAAKSAIKKGLKSMATRNASMVRSFGTGLTSIQKISETWKGAGWLKWAGVTGLGITAANVGVGEGYMRPKSKTPKKIDLLLDLEMKDIIEIYRGAQNLQTFYKCEKLDIKKEEKNITNCFSVCPGGKGTPIGKSTAMYTRSYTSVITNAISKMTTRKIMGCFNPNTLLFHETEQNADDLTVVGKPVVFEPEEIVGLEKFINENKKCEFNGDGWADVGIYLFNSLPFFDAENFQPDQSKVFLQNIIPLKKSKEDKNSAN